MNERFFSLGSVEQLAEDEVVGVAITGDVGRDGDVWCPQGVSLDNFKRNPIVLRQHNPDLVVGSAVAIGLVDANTIGVRIKFAPPGVSAVADETRGLVKSGNLRGISAGIDPIRTEPLDPREPFGAWRVLEAELLEISLVSIPADTGATITGRSFATRPGAAAMLRLLPAVPAHAIARVLGFVGQAPLTPEGLRSPREAFEIDRRRTMAGWALSRARQTETLCYEQRQAELRELAEVGREYGCEKTPSRRRLRPYGG